VTMRSRAVPERRLVVDVTNTLAASILAP